MVKWIKINTAGKNTKRFKNTLNKNKAEENKIEMKNHNRNYTQLNQYIKRQNENRRALRVDLSQNLI